MQTSDWLEQARGMLKRKNQILFRRDSAFLQDLSMLLGQQNHRVVVLWALEFAAGTVARLREAYPAETRPQEALQAARDWAAGRIKMRTAQRKILDCHAFAKEVSRPENAALIHAVGQACATVHTAGHAVGYPIYELTALIYRHGIDACFQAVEARKQVYIDRLLSWAAQGGSAGEEWAAFMRA